MNTGLEPIQVPGVTSEDLPYAPGIDAGGLIFVSGQVALGPDGTVIAPGDLEGQVASVFGKIRDILAATGAAVDDVASCTVFLSRAEDFEEFNRCWRKELGGHRPTRVTVVAQLLVEGLLVEIQAIAVRRASGATA